jgi:hypothetical protein
MAILYRVLILELMYLNWFHTRTEQCMHALLVENCGLNTKQRRFIITAVLYRVLILDCNVFKLAPCKQTTMRTLTCRFKYYTA